MDITTIGGLVLGFILITVVIVLDGGSPAELFSAPQAILLTFGGALIATVISYPLKSVKLIPKRKDAMSSPTTFGRPTGFRKSRCGQSS